MITTPLTGGNTGPTDHLPRIRDVPEEIETLTMDQIEVKSYVGGFVKSFERKAA